MSTYKINKHNKAVNLALEQTLMDLALLQINKLRWHPEDPQLEGTLRWFFSDRSLVQSYMLPKKIGPRAEREGQESALCVIPIDQAIAAAVTASALVADPWERQTVYAASLMSPCGHFVAEHPVSQHERDQARTLNEERAALKTLLLERPLNWLSEHSAPKGRLLRYLLEQPGHDAEVPAQWAPLREVVQRGQVQIKCVW